MRVHYFNYHTKYDREVNINDKNEVAIIGSRSKGYGMGKKRSKAAKNNPKIAELLKSTKLLQFRVDVGKNKELKIKPRITKLDNKKKCR